MPLWNELFLASTSLCANDRMPFEFGLRSAPRIRGAGVAVFDSADLTAVQALLELQSSSQRSSSAVKRLLN